MADATGAPDAARRNPAQPPAYLSLIINAVVLYYMWSMMSGNKGSGSAGKTENETAVVEMATPTASPSAAAVDPSSPFYMLELLKESSSGKKKVMPELQFYEDDRLARLETAKAGAKALHNVWPMGTPLDLFVYLSESPNPVTHFTSASKQTGWIADAAGAEDIAVDAAGNTITAGAAAPVMANETFDGLVTAAASASTAVVGSDSGGDAAAPAALLWHQPGLAYDWQDSNSREQHFNVTLPSSLQHNGSLYAHVYVCAMGASPDPSSSRYNSARVIHVVHPMVRYLKARPKKHKVNLLSGEGDEDGKQQQKVAAWGIGAASDDSGSEAGTVVAGDKPDAASSTSASATEQPILSYFKPTLHLQLVVDHTKYPSTQIPPHVLATIDADPSLGGYKPPLYINEFWMQTHHLSGPLNETVRVVPLTISYSPQSMWKWALQAQMQVSWDTQTAMGASQEGDSDMIKSIITDANPYLLAVTGIVSVLHMLFEFLAFKNDISFWRANKSMEGLSVRSLTINFFQMLIITLYLFENETSYMVLFTQVIGLAIEVWKLRKAISVSLSWAKGKWLPSIDFADKDEAYASSRTKEYDDIATHHMLVILGPMVVGYAAYSLYYDRHRSWYSWILTSAVNYVYLFGFVQVRSRAVD